MLRQKLSKKLIAMPMLKTVSHLTLVPPDPLSIRR